MGVSHVGRAGRLIIARADILKFVFRNKGFQNELIIQKANI